MLFTVQSGPSDLGRALALVVKGLAFLLEEQELLQIEKGNERMSNQEADLECVLKLIGCPAI